MTLTEETKVRLTQVVFVTLIGLMNAGSTGAQTPLKLVQQTLVVDGEKYEVQVPDGFVLDFLTGDLKGPRMISFGPNQEMLIGSKSGVYRLIPPYLQVETLVSLDDYPHSVAWREGYLYIARTSGLYRVAYANSASLISESDLELVAKIPGGLGHSSRTLGVGPDGRLYVSLGISGNCSNEYLGDGYEFEDRRGGVMVLNEATTPARWETFASGLRNPVGFDWHPQTQVLYASNNGPDHLGFDQPPEYFARLTPHSFHGMPWFQFDGGQLLRDPCIKSAPPRPAEEVALPAALLPSRTAPLGIGFVPPGALIEAMQGDAVVALHGSWGTEPFGSAFGNPASRRHPQLVIVRFQDGEAERVEPLVTGFQLPNGGRWARPADVAVGSDGALYFTSDAELNGLFRLRLKRVSDAD